MADQSELRSTFDEDADRYNRYRPHYPEALFKKLIRHTHLTRESHLLEIGPGSGQATEPLAKNGYNITAIELGAALAEKARSVLKTYPNVKIVTGAYEDVILPETQFDLVYSATAFHWIKPEAKFAKTSRLLKSGGYLAVIHTEHVSDEAGDKFFTAAHPLYKKYNITGSISHLPLISQLKPVPMDVSLFNPESFTTFPLAPTYTAEEYIGLLGTYSPIISLPTERRKTFLAGIEKLINTAFGGQIERRLAMTLTIAKKK